MDVCMYAKRYADAGAKNLFLKERNAPNPDYKTLKHNAVDRGLR